MGGKRTFIDKLVSREQRYSIGVERDTGQHYVSILVSNQQVDYEEYYRIDESLFDRLMIDPHAALQFVERCRRRKEDARLIYQPGADRGTAL